LRICYLANGQSVHAQKWVRFFAERGYDVYLATFSEPSQIEGVKVRKLRYFSKVAYPLRIFAVKKAVKEIDPDILHAHYVSHYGVYGALSGFKPFVVTVWGSDVFIDPKKSMAKKYFVKYALKKADLITTDSVSSMKTIVDFGVDEEKVKLIVHGVDLKLFHPVENSEEFKKELCIPQNYEVVISTRSLEPVYDVGTIVKATPHVIDECPNTFFLIVGEGTLRHHLEELACKLGVAENVRFVGSVSNMEIPKFLGVSDIYVSASLSDARSVSLLEAMAYGLPVVVTDLEGNRECVKEGVNGFLFPKGDFKALAEKIIYLLRDEDTRRRFGVISRKYVEKEGSYEKEMRKMEKLYKELVEAYRI
jgi:glycosyltransferase involved in cell wall biosynthesis